MTEEQVVALIQQHCIELTTWPDAVQTAAIALAACVAFIGFFYFMVRG